MSIYDLALGLGNVMTVWYLLSIYDLALGLGNVMTVVSFEHLRFGVGSWKCYDGGIFCASMIWRLVLEML